MSVTAVAIRKTRASEVFEEEIWRKSKRKNHYNARKKFTFHEFPSQSA